ncbi:MAG: transcription antitermination factor NusB [Planctomycetota bacterium]|nr:MAG: transcription antitermination factor NusB [Planctomycetota bacterium]
MASLRRRGRILAMRALCQRDVQGDFADEGLVDFLQTWEESPEARAYARTLVTVFQRQRQQVDDRIAAACDNWDFSRVSPVDRNVMRVAVVEMLGAKVPVKVALNEAIEIAREYGGADSPRFVNGVLDTIRKRLEKPGRKVD